MNQPRIYPDLTQEVEEDGPVNDRSNDGDEESVDEAGPSKPVKKTRRPVLKDWPLLARVLALNK